jgi:metal-responsive CopG/Arc/MetJ family transcriptional regulator
MDKNKKYKKVGVSIELESLNKLKEIQEKESKSLADIINTLIKDYIRSEES